jgi:hypothetical protein
MVDLLVSFVQSLCLIGYLYGAWLVITADGPMNGRESAKARLEDELAWRHYLAIRDPGRITNRRYE